MPEREGFGPTFENTQKAYRSACETLVGELLAAPASPLARKLDEEESRLLVHLQKMKDGKEIESDGQAQSDVIAFDLEGFPVPVALPVGYELQRGRPENRHNMTQLYLFGGETLEEIGNLHGKLTREQVRQQKNAGVGQALRAAGQAGFPDSLSFRKPLSDRLRDRRSMARGGLSVGVRKALSDGATYQDLRNEGFDTHGLSSARQRLSRRQEPVVVPRMYVDWAPTLAAIASPETDRETVCKLIAGLTHACLENHPEIFTGLLVLARSAGLHPRPKLGDAAVIFDYLSDLKAPVVSATRKEMSGDQKVTRRYLFAVRRFAEEIRRDLEKARGPRFERMRKSPVEVIGPAPDAMPTTRDLWGRMVKGKRVSRYAGVFDLLGKHGIKTTSQLRVLGSGLRELIGEKPPVPVLVAVSVSQFFVANAHRQRLAKHLGEQLKVARERAGTRAPE